MKWLFLCMEKYKLCCMRPGVLSKPAFCAKSDEGSYMLAPVIPSLFLSLEGPRPNRGAELGLFLGPHNPIVFDSLCKSSTATGLGPGRFRTPCLPSAWSNSQLSRNCTASVVRRCSFSVSKSLKRVLTLPPQPYRFAAFRSSVSVNS